MPNLSLTRTGIAQAINRAVQETYPNGAVMGLHQTYIPRTGWQTRDISFPHEPERLTDLLMGGETHVCLRIRWNGVVRFADFTLFELGIPSPFPVPGEESKLEPTAKIRDDRRVVTVEKTRWAGEKVASYNVLWDGMLVATICLYFDGYRGHWHLPGHGATRKTHKTPWEAGKLFGVTRKIYDQAD